MTSATSALHTPICDEYGITVPIFGFAHSVDVVVEVCLAGGLGVFGGTRNTPDEIAAALKEIRSRVGSRPFGIDLVIPQGMPERNNREDIEAQLPDEHRAFVDHLWGKYQVPRDGLPGSRSRFVRSEESAQRQVEVVLNSDVDVFAIGVGSPPAVIAEAKSRGKRMVSLVGAPKHAQRAKAAGADVLVAQGYDAGAHTGDIGTFSLVPQVVAVSEGRPVLAAGGVATGRHIAASLALGAQGVWMGTAWLLTKESTVDPVARRQLMRAQGSDTVRTRSDSGKTLRVVRSSWVDEWEAESAPTPLEMPFQDILVGDLLGAIQRHGVEELVHHPAGQGIGWHTEEKSVAQVMRELTDEATTTLRAIRG